MRRLILQMSVSEWLGQPERALMIDNSGFERKTVS